MASANFPIEFPQAEPCRDFPDAIAGWLTRQAKDLLSSTYDDFQLYRKLFIHPAEQAEPVYGPEGVSLGCDRYSVEIAGSDFKKDVKVRVLRPGQLRVLLHRRWVKVPKLISSLPPPPSVFESGKALIPAEKDIQWDEQWAWWRNNGKRFRLLDLPREIRDIIYSFAAGRGKVQPYPYDSCRRIGPALSRLYTARNPDKAGLMMPISKQVLEEYRQELFRDRHFYFEHRRLLRKFAECTTVYNRVTRLELSLSHIGYFSLFGFYVDEEYKCDTSWSAVGALREMRLKEFKFFINCPQRVTCSNLTDDACQRVMCDWIFEAAYDWLKGHPVQVTGWIKTDQREAFQRKLDDARKDFLTWCLWGGYESVAPMEWDEYEYQEDEGVRVDGAPGPEKQSKWPRVRIVERDWPVCRCAWKCDMASWTADD